MSFEDRRTYLKVKVKSLAEEAKIIRKEEKRSQREWERCGLHNHRVMQVREEARHSQLAYGFLKGRSYDQLESGAKPFKPEKVLAMIERFGLTYSWMDPEPGSYESYQAACATHKEAAKKWVADALAKTKQVA